MTLFDPTDLDPDGLPTDAGPHEVAAVLRMLQTGYSGPQIAKKLKMSKIQLQHELKLALDDETEAGRRGQPIYNDRVIVCSFCGDAMTLVPHTTAFRCVVHGTISYESTKPTV